jgi:recombinational DNA repair ATPase RecF
MGENERDYIGMSTIPSDGAPVTKSELKIELEGLRADLLQGLKDLREHLDERTHDAEARLLRAFSDYQHAQTTRFRHMKADLGNLNTASDERLAALEERMTNVEKRMIEKRL